MQRKLHISTDLAIPIDRLIIRLNRNLHIDADGCWLWTGYRKNGYGFVMFGDPPKGEYVHRLSFRLYVGPLYGQQALHRCDVHACFNPDHLFRGTQRDNVNDMRAKNRHHDPRPVFGIKRHMARLDENRLRDLRKLFNAGVDQREIAARFGCSQSTVWRIGHQLTRVWG